MRSDIGLHFLVGVSSTKLSPLERELLKKLSPSGVILFRKNISSDVGWIDQLAELIDEIKISVGRKEVIVGVDHEGGKVHRFPSPVTLFPSAMNWKDSVEAVAAAMSRELCALGFNTGFSPVLDVHSCATNPVIGERAFSSDPYEVASYGQQFIKSLLTSGLLACGKHFPGHGDTTTDSHFELPVVALSKSELLQRELIPFRAAIDATVPMLMTAHVHYPSLDLENPATLSPVIIQGLLRRELGFSGVVISDDLQMKALSYLSPEKIALKALNAGVDILLVGNVNEESPVSRASVMAEAISCGLSSGELSQSELDESQRRIENLLDSIRPEEKNADLNLLGCEKHQRLANELSKSN